MRSIHLVIVAMASAAIAACGGEAPSNRPSSADRSPHESPAPTTTTGRRKESVSIKPPALELKVVGTFREPIDALEVPGTDLVAVVEKGGRVRLVSGMVCAAADDCPAKPVTVGRVALDIADSVSSGSEQGLLGIAFHPSWPDDPRVFIDYTDIDGDTRVETWILAGPSATARRERELLRIKQPFENHNGGHLAFGPDGLLYIGTGDGGSAGDPGDRAQSVNERLGKLLRIDVDAGGERGYGIPRGNVPRGAPEIWALGLRNPWRFSFDDTTGDLWIGDVGQDSREELDALPRSALSGTVSPNFGWRRREGFTRFEAGGAIGPGRLVGPVLDYGRDDGCSITGGVVYRGALVPQLRGWYLFADFCADDLRLLRGAGVPGSTQREGALTYRSVAGAAQVASFGVVQRGEVVLVSLDGSIRQVLPA